MARAVKKKATVGPGGGPDISSFFKKTPSRASITAGEDVKTTLSRPSLKSREAVSEQSAGSAVDPVVISDDEDLPPSPTFTKRKTPPAVEDEVTRLPTSPGAGPSRLPAVSVKESSAAKRSPIASQPGFQTPKSWPEIINVGANGTEDEIDGNETDDSKGTQDPGDDYDDPALDDSGLDMDVMEVDEEPVVEPSGSPEPPGVAPESLPPLAVSGSTTVDLSMEWSEGDDEGMGMEEDEDEVAEQAQAKLSQAKSATRKTDKLQECPVCGKSLKGKPNTVSSHHVNTCLDSSQKNRPITSMAHSFSPAPSSPSPEPEAPVKGPNAFSVLMSGHKEREQWKDAEDDLRRDGKRFYGRRKAPFYKVLTGMPVAVDAFRYGAIPKVTAYLLTHAHSDHYTNLSKSWNHGPIYCSETTGNLIVHMLGVEPQWVHGLKNDVPFEMPNTGGVTVTCIEANHCPGSSIFLFEGPQTSNAGDSGFKSPYVGSKRVFRYLHCGDFRACPKMVLHPAIARARIDTCYLDTTYLNPKYCFPPQPLVIEACATLARKLAKGLPETAPPLPDLKPDVKPDTKPLLNAQMDIYADAALHEEKSKAMMQDWLVKREEGMDVKEELVELKPEIEKPKGRTLIVMGTYSIGKERIVKGVAKALGTTIYCDPRKKGILLCETDPELHAMLSSDPIASMVHLLPLGNIQLDRLQDYLGRLQPHFDRVLGFRPTGWSYSPPAGTDLLPDVNTVIRRDQARGFTDAGLKPMRGSCRQYMMYGVPYSEHSSFFELTCFALSLPGPELKMIATVNVGNEKSRAKMKKWFEKWLAEKSKRREKNLPSVVEYRDETYW